MPGLIAGLRPMFNHNHRAIIPRPCDARIRATWTKLHLSFWLPAPRSGTSKIKIHQSPLKWSSTIPVFPDPCDSFARIGISSVRTAEDSHPCRSNGQPGRIDD